MNLKNLLALTVAFSAANLGSTTLREAKSVVLDGERFVSLDYKLLKMEDTADPLKKVLLQATPPEITQEDYMSGLRAQSQTFSYLKDMPRIPKPTGTPFTQFDEGGGLYRLTLGEKTGSVARCELTFVPGWASEGKYGGYTSCEYDTAQNQLLLRYDTWNALVWVDERYGPDMGAILRFDTTSTLEFCGHKIQMNSDVIANAWYEAAIDILVESNFQFHLPSVNLRRFADEIERRDHLFHGKPIFVDLFVDPPDRGLKGWWVPISIDRDYIKYRLSYADEYIVRHADEAVVKLVGAKGAAWASLILTE